MTFDVSYSNKSKKFLRKADKVIVKRVIEKIEKLRENPVIHDTKTVEGSKGLFRVRVGDYRILYEVDYRNKNMERNRNVGRICKRLA
jgi:mRNA interferase RelE/StbE